MTAIYVLLYLRLFILDPSMATLPDMVNLIIYLLFMVGLFVSVLIDSKILKIGENK